jgi:hypothetical protein
MNQIKKFTHTADRIREALITMQRQRWRRALSSLTIFARYLRDVSIDSQRLGVCLTRSWFGAAKQSSIRIRRSLDDLPYYIQTTKQLFEESTPKVPGLSFLVAELQALEQEFGFVELDKQDNSIAITTGPITLEGVYLGPFRIKLGVDRLGDLRGSLPYDVIALDPHPSSTCEDVTHPHVSDEQLCEGDAHAAVTAALSDGRLLDFFTIVNNILHTYNPDSPHVTLLDWDGEPCYECGYVAGRDESYYCSYCGHVFCQECSTYCRSCDESVCLGCATECPICDELNCPNCIGKCSQCGEQVCTACIQDELCPTCRAETENKDDKREDTDRPNQQDEQAAAEQAAQIRITASAEHIRPGRTADSTV